ncbi:Dolichol-phosphate mannosyltransferase [hydrothermal vent metagenome]|uniref:Dolichol-phosphate mannosyltransferase n=1 Tax=hydrothermal vent metagenome TaxID=652676 RepID=A0A1W1C451_9ZZZZ
MKNGIVIIPTYNEIDNIESIIEKVFALELGLDILIVDDNSPDKTYERVQELIDERYQETLHLMVREKKAGLGKAYIAGFKWALAHKKKYNYIIEMDADLSHNPKYLPIFTSEIEKYDLIIGSRYVKGGGATNWPLFRKAISYGGSFYSRMILGVKIMDITGGFKCFRREVLEAINLDNIITTGYSFQIEMNYKATLKGFKIKEIPIVFEERIAGRSKMTKKVFIEALGKVVTLRLNKNRILQEG